MTDEEMLHRLWREASRRAGEPQCVWPSVGVLRAFYRAAYADGLQAGLETFT